MEKNEKQPSGRTGKLRKIFACTALILLTLTVTAVIAFSFYWNRLLNRMSDAHQPVAAIPSETIPETVPTEETTTATAPEDTWPEVISEEAVTNIMLIGQNQNLADTMILCSINRESETLTLVSFLRDLYVPIPAYAGHSADRNRINACYYWGGKWAGKVQGGMELLGLCIQQNFGIPIDHSIAVDFEVFTQAIDTLGGVEIDLTEQEARYLSKKVGYVGEFQPGLQTLNGMEALAYSRIRKIDSDVQRTGRQRNVLTSLMAKCRSLNLMQLHTLATTVLPMITTDMTNQELTGYLWEFLPMLKTLKIQTATCPVNNSLLPGSCWDEKVEIGGIPCDVIACSIRRNRDYLTDLLGLSETQT